MKKERGITLIALIITIIILIILTAVTISNVMNSNLFGLAKGAAENYIQAGKEEDNKIDELIGELGDLGVGKDSKVKAGEIVKETKKDNYTDAEGRTATIPAGFKVSTKTEEQNIKSGLVIQDEDGNEFVWIPCYYGEKPENAPSDLQAYKKHKYAENGIVDDTKDVTSDTEEGEWKTFYYTKFAGSWEDTAAEEYGNSSVSTYGGFYIGRYEAVWPEYDTSLFTGDSHQYIVSEEDEIAKKNVTDKKPISKANVFCWNFITQKNAKVISKNMYAGSQSVRSELVDGTAWDTITSWISTDEANINVNNSNSYGNYFDNDSSYTGWYAEHILSNQIAGQETGGTIGFLYATKFKKGTVGLLRKEFK